LKKIADFGNGDNYIWINELVEIGVSSPKTPQKME